MNNGKRADLASPPASAWAVSTPSPKREGQRRDMFQGEDCKRIATRIEAATTATRAVAAGRAVGRIGSATGGRGAENSARYGSRRGASAISSSCAGAFLTCCLATLNEYIEFSTALASLLLQLHRRC